MRHVIWSCSTLLPSTIWADTKSFSNKTKGDNSKSKKGRVVNPVRDMLSGPVLHFYQVSSKYSKGYSSYRADKKFYTDADGIQSPKIILLCPPPHLWWVGREGHNTTSETCFHGKNQEIIYLTTSLLWSYLLFKWAATLEKYRLTESAPSEDFNQPTHPSSLISLLVYMKKLHILGYSGKILIRLRKCAGWSESSLAAHVQRYVFCHSGSNVYIFIHMVCFLWILKLDMLQLLRCNYILATLSVTSPFSS